MSVGEKKVLATKTCVLSLEKNQRPLAFLLVSKTGGKMDKWEDLLEKFVIYGVLLPMLLLVSLGLWGFIFSTLFGWRW